MGIIRKVSEKEKKLFFVLITVLILVISYQFGFQRFTNKADALSLKNKALSSLLAELHQKQSKQEKNIEETIELNIQTKDMLDQFPNTLSQEQSTLFVTNLEKYSGIKISSIAFQELSIFYTSQEVKEAEEPQVNNENAEIEISEPKAEDNLDITGYNTGIVLTYQTTYNGLKKCIEYINEYEDRINISDLSAAFDHTTGNLTGTMTLQMYALVSADTVYQVPEVTNIDIGTDNIFGTFELPMQD